MPIYSIVYLSVFVRLSGQLEDSKSHLKLACDIKEKQLGPTHPGENKDIYMYAQHTHTHKHTQAYPHASMHIHRNLYTRFTCMMHKRHHNYKNTHKHIKKNMYMHTDIKNMYMHAHTHIHTCTCTYAQTLVFLLQV